VAPPYEDQLIPDVCGPYDVTIAALNTAVNTIEKSLCSVCKKNGLPLHALIAPQAPEWPAPLFEWLFALCSCFSPACLHAHPKWMSK